MRVWIQTHTKTSTRIPPTDYSNQHPNKHIRQNTYFSQLTTLSTLFTLPEPYRLSKENMQDSSQTSTSNSSSERVCLPVSLSAIRTFHKLGGTDSQKNLSSTVHPSQDLDTPPRLKNHIFALSFCSAEKGRIDKPRAESSKSCKNGLLGRRIFCPSASSSFRTRMVNDLQLQLQTLQGASGSPWKHALLHAEAARYV